MCTAAVPDLDGLGILVSEELYWDLHHKLGHNLFFFALVAVVCGVVGGRERRGRFTLALLCFGLGWLHFAMDYLGSGPGWGLFPFWPVSDVEVRWAGAWPFYSWQNLGSFGVLLLATLAIAWCRGRTPLEAIMPRLDRWLVDLLQRNRKPPA